MDSSIERKTSVKYRIGKVKQIPSVVKDERTGLDYIQLQNRESEKVYGVTRFMNNYREEEKLAWAGDVWRGVQGHPLGDQ